jgi:hypothetical protein
MNTIWLKIAAVAVVLVAVLIVGSRFMSDKPGPSASSEPAAPSKTVYDSFERDDREFGVQDKAAEAPAQEIAPPEEAPAAQDAQPTFEKLPTEEEIQAQKLHSMALEERKRSRLPMMTPKLMVDYCRQIIQRWPTSEYAFQAKRMLADIPDRYKKMYNVTDQETDVSSFYK